MRPAYSLPKDTPEVCARHCDSTGMRLAAVLERAPYALETSLPGVFAAVADGAIAVRSIWDYLNRFQ